MAIAAVVVVVILCITFLSKLGSGLGVPDSENIIMTVSDSPYYWETGECTLVNVTFTENGEVVAGADVNVDTAECTTSLYTYTPKG